jgi:hypothetical protein
VAAKSAPLKMEPQANRSQEQAPVACSKLTPCLRRLAAAFLDEPRG